jgi:hypothetical protein
MSAKTVANIRRQMIALERQLSELAKVSTRERALRLASAADLLTEARACDLWRLR